MQAANAFSPSTKVSLRVYRTGAELKHGFPPDAFANGTQFEVFGLPANPSYLTLHCDEHPCSRFEAVPQLSGLADGGVLRGKFVQAANADHNHEGIVFAMNGANLIFEDASRVSDKKFLTELTAPTCVRTSDLTDSDRERLRGASAVRFQMPQGSSLTMEYMTPDVSWSDTWHVFLKQPANGSDPVPCAMEHYFAVKNESGVSVRSTEGMILIDGTAGPQAERDRRNKTYHVTAMASPASESAMLDVGESGELGDMRVVHVDSTGCWIRPGSVANVAAAGLENGTATFVYYVDVDPLGGVSPVKYEMLIGNRDAKLYVSCRAKLVVRASTAGSAFPSAIVGTPSLVQTCLPGDDDIRACMGFADNVKCTVWATAPDKEGKTRTASGTIVNQKKHPVTLEVRLIENRHWGSPSIKVWGAKPSSDPQPRFYYKYLTFQLDSEIDVSVTWEPQPDGK